MHRRWLEAGNFGFRKKRNCTIRVAKTKALISCAVTVHLCFCICKMLISHGMAHLIRHLKIPAASIAFPEPTPGMTVILSTSKTLRGGKQFFAESHCMTLINTV